MYPFFLPPSAPSGNAYDTTVTHTHAQMCTHTHLYVPLTQTFLRLSFRHNHSFSALSHPTESQRAI